MGTKKTKFQKVMAFMIPVIVLLLITAIVMTFALILLNLQPRFIAKAKNITILMALASALLAIAAIVFAIVSKSSESAGEAIVDEVEKIIEAVSQE